MKKLENPYLLHAENLVKRYHNKIAVDHLNLHVRKGECFALLGPNGAGKTTTCEMLEGLIVPDGGELAICGMNYQKSRKEILEIIGVQLQETHLYRKYTVLETLQLFASFYRRQENIDDLLGRLNLKDLQHRRLEALSGGQRQAVYIGCTLINHPALVFLDEPTAGLDPHARRMIWDLILELKNEERGIFLTTHYLEEAERLAGRIAIMNQGKIIAEGSPSELVATYCPGEIWGFAIEGPEHETKLQKETLKLRLPWLSPVNETRGACEMLSSTASQHLQELTLVANREKIPLHSMFIRRSTLEDVFLKITGRAFRDEVR